MKRGVAKRLLVLTYLLTIIMIVIFAASHMKTAMILTFIVACVIITILNAFMCCRNCGRWPRKHDFFDKHCPRCGTPYDE